ncbi:GEFF-like protein [Mya arenaria]|uniref:GEFF-like protein n=1 Tax=Mya arenaria TaxID=6604 RepID=A0ABY7D8E9_MYAAR|nr:GEFF-like protein [Mya arenaria]
MLIFGGEFGDSLTESSLWIINPDDEEWEQVKPKQSSRDQPGGRHGHSAVMFNKHMVIYGGSCDLVPKAELWSYSLGSERWTQIMMNDSTPARMYHSALFVTPSAENNAIKASSMPYLQKKIAKMKLERPRSSPGERSSIASTSGNSVNCGIDNPGVSDSTEELIRESSVQHLYQDGGQVDSISKGRSVFERSLSYTTELERSQKRSESVLLPNECETMEIIELENCLSRTRSKSTGEVHTCFLDKQRSEKVTYSKETEEVQILAVKARRSDQRGVTVYPDTKQREVTGSHYSVDSRETTFMSSDGTEQGGPRLYQKKQQQANNRVIKPTVPQESPYILVIGGRDNQTVNFGIKPLQLWKLQILKLHSLF